MYLVILLFDRFDPLAVRLLLVETSQMTPRVRGRWRACDRPSEAAGEGVGPG